jgi:hypothetical protein
MILGMNDGEIDGRIAFHYQTREIAEKHHGKRAEKSTE